MAEEAKDIFIRKENCEKTTGSVRCIKCGKEIERPCYTIKTSGKSTVTGAFRCDCGAFFRMERDV